MENQDKNEHSREHQDCKIQLQGFSDLYVKSIKIVEKKKQIYNEPGKEMCFVNSSKEVKEQEQVGKSF